MLRSDRKIVLYIKKYIKETNQAPSIMIIKAKFPKVNISHITLVRYV